MISPWVNAGAPGLPELGEIPEEAARIGHDHIGQLVAVQISDGEAGTEGLLADLPVIIYRQLPALPDAQVALVVDAGPWIGVGRSGFKAALEQVGRRIGPPGHSWPPGPGTRRPARWRGGDPPDLSRGAAAESAGRRPGNFRRPVRGCFARDLPPRTFTASAASGAARRAEGQGRRAASPRCPARARRPLPPRWRPPRWWSSGRGTGRSSGPAWNRDPRG